MLIALLAPACPGLLRLPHLTPTALAVALGCLVLLAALPATPWWVRCRRALSAVLADLRALHTSPARAADLWGGSLAFATLHSLVLISVTRAVGLPLPPLQVALLYLAASSTAALLPTPGGLGSLDAALVFALTLMRRPRRGRGLRRARLPAADGVAAPAAGPAGARGAGAAQGPVRAGSFPRARRR